MLKLFYYSFFILFFRSIFSRWESDIFWTGSATISGRCSTAIGLGIE